MPKYKKVVVYDLETTGFSPIKNSLLEIAAISLYPDGKEESWNTLIRPLEAIPEHITKLTGISKQTLNTEPVMELRAALDRFLDLIIEPDTLLVSHNGIAFDNPFLAAKGLPLPAIRCWDTLLQTRADIKRKRKTNWIKTQEAAKLYRTKQKVNLLDAAKYYRIKVKSSQLHRAMPDARTCLEIFKKQLIKNKWVLWNKEQQ